MTKLTDIPGAKEAAPNLLYELSHVHLEVDVEAMALELARAVFGIYAPNAKAVPDPLWEDYMNFAKHLANNPEKWARLVRK